MKLFLSPHNDDETLFGAFTLMREKPLVVIVTDSYIQSNRGENITADQRWMETVRAMEILGCSVIRLGIRDDIIYPEIIDQMLSRFKGFEEVYAPAIQGGNKDHDMVGEAAIRIFGHILTQYSTYSKSELYIEGKTELKPNADEDESMKKFRALECYKSQLELPATAPHFEAVRGKSEWYI